MKVAFIFLVALICGSTALAQRPDDVLATATSHSFTLADLSAETQAAVAAMPGSVSATRKAIYDQLINQRLIDLEARSLGISSGKLLGNEKAKVPNPSEAEIVRTYEANRKVLGSLTLDESRKQIIGYLRSGPEQNAMGTLFERLRAKYKYLAGKDVNAVGLGSTDVVATINSQPITAREYENFAQVALFELKATLSDLIRDDLNAAIYDALVKDEAKSNGIDAGELIAREITNKLRDFSNEERITLENGLNSRLLTKYKVKILYKAPEPLVQNISADDDPATGPADAPVTIIMFSDFQCSACSATHPILKKAMAAYPGKIRFVVRDFPLESIHENGFKAALAAGAANLQGKFFEFIEQLYTHQDALDVISLKKYAAELGLNAKQFELDFNSEKVAAEVRKDMADGDSYLVNSTPTIFVNGVRVRNLSLDGFTAAIDRALPN
jgi:protein-disulfide isomerase